MTTTVGSEVFATARERAERGPLAVSIRNVSKSFKLPHQQYHTLKERALHPFRSRSFDTLQAVRDISIDVAAGEFFGIVGRNGSGKSTLLKCLAGIYGIDDGEIHINGRLSPFIELGVGFNADLTARDNVIINAIMLGLSRKQAVERFDDIIAFAELEEFVDLKLKNYSSGMYVRLAFATAVQVDADILLIDEVLAVGDANFQQKCFDEFTRLREEGRTILFVTHDMGAVERYCDRAMLIEQGTPVAIGAPTEITRRYNQHNFRRTRIESGASPSEIPDEHPPARVLNAWFQSADGETVVVSHQRETCVVKMLVAFDQHLKEPIFAISLLNESGQPVFVTNTSALQMSTGEFAAGTEATIDMRFENYLAPGRYRLVASVARAGLGADIFDAHMTNSLIVLGHRPGGGLADLPNAIEIDRGS